MQARYNGKKVLIVNFGTGMFTYINESRCILSSTGLDKLTWEAVEKPTIKVNHNRVEYRTHHKKVTT